MHSRSRGVRHKDPRRRRKGRARILGHAHAIRELHEVVWCDVSAVGMERGSGAIFYFHMKEKKNENK